MPNPDVSFIKQCIVSECLQTLTFPETLVIETDRGTNRISVILKGLGPRIEFLVLHYYTL